MINNFFESFGKIIVALGGAGVVITAISGWLSKLWAKWFMEKQKKQYAKDIEEYKNQLQVELEKTKALNDELLHKSNTIFDNELEIYKELVPAMIKTSQEVQRWIALVNTFHNTKEITEVMHVDKVIYAFKSARTETFRYYDVLLKYSVFIDENNYTIMMEFFKKCLEVINMKDDIEKIKKCDWDEVLDELIVQENYTTCYLRNNLRQKS